MEDYQNKPIVNYYYSMPPFDITKYTAIFDDDIVLGYDVTKPIRTKYESDSD
jgi:hypothetical protein